MNKIAYGLMVMTLVHGVAHAAFYEWIDPDTGKLKGGDQPPGGGVEYWVEGQRPPPKPTKPDSERTVHDLTDAERQQLRERAQRQREKSQRLLKQTEEYALPDDVRRKRAAQRIIKRFGYRCDQVDAMRPALFGDSVIVYCNNMRYSYEVEDQGGIPVVTVQ